MDFASECGIKPIKRANNGLSEATELHMMARLISRLDQVVIKLPRTVFMVSIAPVKTPGPRRERAYLVFCHGWLRRKSQESAASR